MVCAGCAGGEMGKTLDRAVLGRSGWARGWDCAGEPRDKCSARVRTPATGSTSDRDAPMLGTGGAAMPGKPDSSRTLRSAYADDPEMTELLEVFCEEMPLRAAALESAARERTWEELQRLAHQLKGAGAGYGFDQLSEVAGELERRVKALRDDECPLESVCADVEALADLCRRVRA